MDQNASPAAPTVVPGTISFDPATNTASWGGPNPIKLSDGDEIEITFSGFPTGSTLEQVVVYSATPPGQQQVWTPGSGKIIDDSFTFSLQADSIENPLWIMDAFHFPSIYYLSANGFVGGSNRTWKIDPEVINHAGTPGPPGGEKPGDGTEP